MEQDHVILLEWLKVDLMQTVKVVFVFYIYSFQLFDSFFHVMILSLNLVSLHQKEVPC